MYTTLFWIIIAILVLDFALEWYLDYLNNSQVSEALPDEVKDLYDAEAYKKQQQYFLANKKFGMVSGLFSFVVMMLMFFLFGFAFVDNIARGFSENSIVIALIFFGILYFANEVLNIPFGIYHTFKIEERFGFNKMTPALFAADTVKGWLLTVLLGGGVLALLMLIYNETGAYFWLIAWAVMSGISIFMLMFYSNLIVPLFNKQTPLEEGELRTAIQEFCKKVDFGLDDLYVIDGSKRTTKANAYFTGLGSKKRIVLYDTLMNTLTTEEIVAVLSHEIGHYKHKHTLLMLLISILNTGFMLFLLSLALGTPETGNVHLAEALGSQYPSFHLGVIVFGILYTPISTLLGVGLNVISRRNEFQADSFAKENGLGEELGEALKKLSVSTLSNLNPHKAYVFFHYSHPTLIQRIRNLKN
ncbi:MAG: M48 family metallopeptidase [Paludibacteraceae bacterium]|nr:M48 family metallopeptidase [Paludibacteraceae bacterium]